MVKLAPYILLVLNACVLMAATGSAGAQSSAGFPNKAVRIIVPYAPGGATDVLARVLAERLAKDLGQPFIVENRAGGGTVLGTNSAAKATADGYTLLVTTEALLANHWLQPGLPYDSLKDFALVTPLGRSESALTVHPSVPVKSLTEFISYARANPAKLNIAVTSAVGVLNLHKFTSATGTRFTIVNYNGGAPAMTDLLGGNVQFVIFNALNVLPFIKDGRLKGYAISGDKRDPELPDTPTFAEGGVRDFDPAGPVQYPLLAPSKTPKEVVEKLNAQVRRALGNPELIGRLAQIRVKPVPTTVAQAETHFRQELERYGKLVKESGIKPGDF